MNKKMIFQVLLLLGIFRLLLWLGFLRQKGGDFGFALIAGMYYNKIAECSKDDPELAILL